jgi:hypothetical protein
MNSIKVSFAPHFPPAVGRLFCGIALYFCLTVVPAQSVLVTIGTPANQLVSVNLVTCEVTTVINSLNIGNITDIVMGPDGSIYLQGFSGGNSALFRWDPVTGDITLLTEFPQSPLAGSLLLLNDSTIFVHTRNNFFTYSKNLASLKHDSLSIKSVDQVLEDVH